MVHSHPYEVVHVHLYVDNAGQQAPSGRSGGDQGEDLCLVPQQGEIRDRFAAVGEHHRQIDRGERDRCPVAEANAARL